MAGPAYYDGTMNIAKNEDWIVPFIYGSYAADGVTVVPIDLTNSTASLKSSATAASPIRECL